MYYALIGDIINSREIKDRNQVQNELLHILNVLNERFSSTIVSNLTITLGDEFQGLFSDIETVFLVIDILDTHCSSGFAEIVHIRYGIGYGEILTEINPDLSIGADGPVYWNAREAIDTVNRSHDGYNTNTHLCIGGDSTIEDAMIRMLDAIRNNWTNSQAQFMYEIFTLFNYQDISPGLISRTLDLSPQQVSNRLKASYARQYLAGRKALIQLIRRQKDD